MNDADFGADRRQVNAANNRHWDRFWERTYNAALLFEKLTPAERAKRLSKAAKAAKAARAPLIKGRDMATREEAELVFWAVKGLDL